jgi:hypothetical protein
MISKSWIPGGSPVALADPERWSLFGFECRACGTLLCDRCATRAAGLCDCGQPLRRLIAPAAPQPAAEGTAVETQAAPNAASGRARIFATAIAAQADGTVVDYSTIDFGRQRKPGASTLLLDRRGRPDGERGVAMVRHLRGMGLPPGVQVFANALRDLSGNADHAGRDQLVFVDSADPFDVIRVAEVDPVNHGLSAEDVVERLVEWHRNFGIEIVAADTETVVLRFLRLPDDTSALVAEICEFCPDLEETFQLEPQALVESPWLWLWWD